MKPTCRKIMENVQNSYCIIQCIYYTKEMNLCILNSPCKWEKDIISSVQYILNRILKLNCLNFRLTNISTTNITYRLSFALIVVLMLLALFNLAVACISIVMCVIWIPDEGRIHTPKSSPKSSRKVLPKYQYVGLLCIALL